MKRNIFLYLLVYLYQAFESTVLHLQMGVIAAVLRDLHCQRVPTLGGLAGCANAFTP